MAQTHPNEGRLIDHFHDQRGLRIESSKGLDDTELYKQQTRLVFHHDAISGTSWILEMKNGDELARWNVSLIENIRWK